MYPGRGVLHTPPERFQRRRRDSPMHKNDHSPPPAVFVGRMLLRPYRSWYTDLLTIRFFSFLVFFSCLDARKEPKENQGIRDAGQILGIQLIWTYLAKLPRPRQRAFSCLDARKEPKENQGVRDASQILGIQLIWTYPAKLPCPRQRTFSRLDVRKETKENQGVRDASQFWLGTY